MVLGIAEHLADDSRTLSDIFINDGRRHHFEEGGVDVGGQGARQQRLAGARWAVEQDTLGRLDTYAREQLGVGQR